MLLEKLPHVKWFDLHILPTDHENAHISKMQEKLMKRLVLKGNEVFVSLTELVVGDEMIFT